MFANEISNKQWSVQEVIGMIDSDGDGIMTEYEFMYWWGATFGGYTDA
jgi:hypothetical protein